MLDIDGEKMTKKKSTVEELPEPNIQGLFATPVLVTKFYRDWTKKEKKFFDDNAKSVIENVGNTTSANRYILDDPAMKEIREYYQFYLNYYMEKIYAPKNNVEVYITQSWMNFTKTGQYHHKHSHPNSWLSGCIYINTDRETDSIKFFNDKYNQIHLPTENYNIFNSESWWFYVGTGDICIFPSYLSHMVEPTTNSDTRVSISINTFVKGHIGDEHSFSSLHLRDQNIEAIERTEKRPENLKNGY